MNPSKFKAPFLQKGDIETKAQAIRANYPSTRAIPVNVLAFAEFDLGLEFDFAPIQQLRQDAFLRPDLTGIWFDPIAFKEPSLQSRLRFSTAHELAHLFLHKDIYGALNFRTVKQWIRFIDNIPAKEYHWIEWQADEFAGRFLIPTERLQPVLREAINNAESEGFFEQGPEEALDACCRATHAAFGVSFSAMQTRIRKSGFWPPPALNPN